MPHVSKMVEPRVVVRSQAIFCFLSWRCFALRSSNFQTRALLIRRWPAEQCQAAMSTLVPAANLKARNTDASKCSCRLLQRPQPVQVLGVMFMQRGNNCLFHALAFHDFCSGEALKQELADFLDVCARHNVPSDATRAWSEEASRLRDRDHANWGTHTSVVAYSAMRGRKVFVHTWRANGVCDVQDLSHSTAPANAPTTHILYDGKRHYDALVEMTVVGSLSSSWGAHHQPPPPPNAPAPSLWGSFQSWAGAPGRDRDIAGHVLQVLSVYVWLTLNSSCPGPFLRDLQSILRRAMPNGEGLPEWVHSMVHLRDFV